MSEHPAPGTLVSGDHSMQHLIVCEGCNSRSGQTDGRQCQSNPSPPSRYTDNARATLHHPLVIQTMPEQPFTTLSLYRQCPRLALLTFAAHPRVPVHERTIGVVAPGPDVQLE